MERLVFIALLVATGCSAADESNDNSSNANSTPNSANSTPNNANANPNNTANTRPTLVESANCFAEPANPVFSPAELAYAEETEVALGDARREYGSFCGSAMEVRIDWEALLASVGFDEGEIGEPGAVAAAALPFLEGARVFCEGSSTGGVYRAAVQRVVLTATDSDGRVGLCFDETSGALVSRFMLIPDETTATQLDEAAVTEWLTTNLQ